MGAAHAGITRILRTGLVKQTTGRTETERVLRSFPILTVFDISQTDPIKGVEQVDDLAVHVEGDDVAGVATTVTP